MANQYLRDYIIRELQNGKSEHEIRKWLVSAGLSAAEVEEAFRNAAALRSQPSADIQELYETAVSREPQKENKMNWKKIIAPALVVLAVAVLGLVAFKYSKNLASAVRRTADFTIQTYDKIFKKNKAALPAISTGTSTISVVQTPTPSPTTTIAIVTSTAATSTAGTSTSATLTAATTADNITFSSAIIKSRDLWSAGKYNESLTAAQSALQKAQTSQEEAKAQYWIGLSY